MHLTRPAPLLACLWAASALAVEATPTRGADPLDATRDEVVARSPVPSPERPVGEVRLIRRGDANVIETLLHTKLLRRVVGEIRQKELANWPEGPRRADALRYVEALSAVQQQLWGRLLASEPARDRRQKLWIDFVLTPDASLVAIGAFEMDEAGGELRVTSREPLAVLELPRAYVLRNMRLIAADSFRLEGDALGSLLEPLELLRAVGDGSGG